MELVGQSSTVVEPVLDDAAAALASAVNRNRARLLRSGTAVTVAQIAQASDRSADTVRRWLTRKEDAGRLVVVRHAGELLIPSVQLTDAFDTDEEVGDVVARLVAFGMGPWAVWDWLHTHNGWLGCSPADAIERGDVTAVQHAVDGLQ